MVAEEVSGGSDEVHLQFRAEKLDKKVSGMTVTCFEIMQD